MTGWRCFAVMAPAALAGLAAGGVTCLALDLPLSAASAWLVLGAGLVAAVAAGAAVLHSAAPTPTPPDAAEASPPPAAPPADPLRRLRHDIRGALSPALLTADRLLTHADPAVQRAGDIMVRAVERAASLLSDSRPPDATPPDRS